MAKRQAKKRAASFARPGHGRITASSQLTEDAEVLFRRVSEEVLHGHRWVFDKLNAHERRLVIDWMSDAIVDGEAQNALHDVLWEMDYVRKPVDIKTFIHDDFYFGQIAGGLHPRWKDDLYEVFDPNSGIFEWVMTGAIGIGKTTLAGVGLAYKLYCMSCLRDPAAYYGLLAGSQVIFGVYSITKRQVADTGYHNIRGYIDASPYFRQQFPRSTKIDSLIDFEPRTRKKIKVIPGSTELHALGLNLFAFLMDEVNFMRVKDNKDQGVFTGQAYDLYNATYTRLLSRFTRPGGTLPGMMFLLSSRNAQTSFLEEHLRSVRSSVHSKSTHISDYALWECKNKNFTWPGFRVEVGDRVSKSRLLKKKEEPRKGAKVVEVPWEYHKPFTEDVDQALRDIAGVATFNLSPLISDRASVYDAVRTTLEHPFTREEIVIDTGDDVRIEDFFVKRTAARVKASRWVPKLNPESPRFIHVDIGLTGDALGFAMGHVAGLVKSDRVDAEGVVSTVTNPYIVIDLMLRVTSPPGGEVDLSKVRAFIQFLGRIYPILRVTFDQFQSKDSIQILKKLRFDSGHQSLDTTDEGYMTLKSALFDRRVAMYAYAKFQDEVLDLERDVKKRRIGRWGKVDHPTRSSKGGKGSKDIADAVAGVVWLCMNDDRALHSSVIAADVLNSSPGDLALVQAKSASDTTASRPAPRVGAAKTTWDELRSNV